MDQMCNLCALYDTEDDCCSKEVVCFECHNEGEYTGARCIFDRQLDNLFEPIKSEHKQVKMKTDSLERRNKELQNKIDNLQSDLKIKNKENRILKERLTKI